MIFSKVLHLLDGKKQLQYIWNILLFHRRTFTTGEIINIPADKVLILRRPSVDEEIILDGELYII